VRRKGPAETKSYESVKRSLDTILQNARLMSPQRALDDPPLEDPAAGGSICLRAAVRVRPSLKRASTEVRDDAEHSLNVSGNTVTAGGDFYVFHRCFEHHDNEQIFEVEGGPLVQSVLSGYNGTLIAYGQTGSGKTHTIAGVDGDEGQMPRLLRRLFDEISDSPDFLWDVSLQYLQVYNDQAFDLLPAHNGGDADAPLRVREETEGTIVDGAASVKLACCEEGLWALASGSSNQ